MDLGRDDAVTPAEYPRAFNLERRNDESGVSGTGIVLEGCIFTDGRVAVRWRGNTRSSVIYDNFQDFWFLHVASHPSNATVVRFLDGEVIFQ